jgi:hypothetical protein
MIRRLPHAPLLTRVVFVRAVRAYRAHSRVPRGTRSIACVRTGSAARDETIFINRVHCPCLASTRASTVQPHDVDVRHMATPRPHSGDR